tara:strand:+ start:373 stop:636 length:264 start_codon:yes stop_codon:yes gene_type:complete
MWGKRRDNNGGSNSQNTPDGKEDLHHSPRRSRQERKHQSRRYIASHGEKGGKKDESATEVGTNFGEKAKFLTGDGKFEKKKNVEFVW